MKRQLSFILTLGVFLLSWSPLSAQNEVGNASKGFKMPPISVGLGVGTLGVGPILGVEVNDHLAVRAELSFFHFKHSDKITVIVPEEVKAYKKENANLHADYKLGLSSASALVDYYVSPRSSFHITAGLIFGKMSMDMNGILRNQSNEAPYVEGIPEGLREKIRYEIDDDYALQTDKEGSMSGTVTFGNRVKPYVGFGFGRAVPNKRIGFGLDLGVMYQGKLSFSSPNITGKNGKTLNDYVYDQIGDSDKTEKYLKLAQWFPVLMLRLKVRLN